MEDEKKPERGRLFRNDHQKRSVRAWILPLAIIVAVIIFLPKLVALLEK